MRLAGWLLALETIGAALLVSGGDYMAQGKFDPLMAFAALCVVLVVWAAPNAFVFYKQRAKFAEPETKKPGL